jgi:hypothetical protein
MIQHWLNWRTVLTLIAILIVSGTVFYSDYLSKKIAKEEKQKVEAWVEAQRTIVNSTDNANLNLASRIITENDDIPIIETNEKDSITNNYLNLDSALVASDRNYLTDKLEEFKKVDTPLTVVLSENPYLANKYYYGESQLQKEVRYYPIIQLVIIGLFILITVISQRSFYQNTQNQVWAGLAKETAHQLGTPVTSLEGWVEVLKGINFNTNGETNIPAMISPPLFDWVIENLLKNALDAMNGKGNINVTIKDEAASVLIDVKDTGKGISYKNISKVFRPGFSTKKRGWGLGLTLSKRIVEQYHGGQIFVKSSEPGKGTTFRVVLKK